MIAIKKVAACAISIWVFGIFSVNLQAQQLYRIVGADGKITFSDQPPPVDSTAKVTSGRGGRFDSNPAIGNPTLPTELRTAVTRYPVILYTAKDCAPCNAVRNMLASRGVPVTERTIENNLDGEALQRLSGDTALPFGMIGGQQLKGYSDQEWAQYLDAAGYPKTSVLPAAYRNPTPTPMVARAAPTPAPAAETAPERAAAPAAQEPANPAGIRF